MPVAVRTRSQLLEYALLHNVQAAGKKIGLYMGSPIHEVVVDDYGRRYVFNGLAPRAVTGELDPTALRTGEFIVLPGLAYRIVRPG